MPRPYGQQSLRRCLTHPRTPIKGKQASPVLRTLDGEPWGVSETASATAAPKGRHSDHIRASPGRPFRHRSEERTARAMTASRPLFRGIPIPMFDG